MKTVATIALAGLLAASAPASAETPDASAAPLPPAQPTEVQKELEQTPPSELNLRCQGFFTALGQANSLRKQATSLVDPDRAVDRLQEALVAEAVAAAGEGYSVKQRLAQARDAAKGLLPKARAQAARFVTLLRKPKEADAQTLANQEAVCRAVLAKLTG